MRSRAGKSLVGLGIALGGYALSFVYAPAAVAITFAGMVVTVPMDFNVAGRRAATYLALLFHAASIYVGSGSLLLAAVPLPFAFWLLPTEFMIKRPALFALSPVIGIGASVLLFALAWPTGSWGFAVAPWLLGLLPLSRWTDFAKGVRAFDQLAKPLKVGQPIPELKLPRRDGGEVFDLAERNGRFTLLCFLRGDWCPICHVMMRVFCKEATTLARHNVDLVAISPDHGPSAAAFARDLGVGYAVLVDEHAQLAKAWGILDIGQHNGDPVPMPVCMLVDPRGILRFMSRPEDFSSIVDKSRVLALVEAHAAKAA